MKLKYILAVCLLVALYPFVCFAQQTNEPPELIYFFNEPCLSCVPKKENAFIQLYNQTHGERKKDYPMTLKMINIFTLDGLKTYQQTCLDYGIQSSAFTDSIFIAGDLLPFDMAKSRLSEQCLVAHEMLKSNILTADVIQKNNLLTKDNLFSNDDFSSDTIHFILFYRILCPECVELEPFIDDFPKTLSVDDIAYNIDIKKINTRQPRGGDKIYALFEKYNVPAEHQGVPILFYKDGYISGKENIEKTLPTLLLPKNLDAVLNFDLSAN